MKAFFFALCSFVGILHAMPIWSNNDWTAGFQHECARQLHDKCIPEFEGKSLNETFPTCGISELVNCLEKELNDTSCCNQNTEIHDQMENYTKEIKLDYVDAKICPTQDDVDYLIEELIDPDYAKWASEDDQWDDFWDPIDLFEDDEIDEESPEDDSDPLSNDWLPNSLNDIILDIFGEEVDAANGTDTTEGTENNTKDKIKENENTKRNASREIEKEKDEFLDDVMDALAYGDDWTDWEEDNEDDVSDGYGDGGLDLDAFGEEYAPEGTLESGTDGETDHSDGDDWGLGDGLDGSDDDWYTEGEDTTDGSYTDGDGKTNGKTDGNIDGKIDGNTDGDGYTDEDGWTDGSDLFFGDGDTDDHTDGSHKDDGTLHEDGATTGKDGTGGSSTTGTTHDSNADGPPDTGDSSRGTDSRSVDSASHDDWY